MLFARPFVVNCIRGQGRPTFLKGMEMNTFDTFNCALKRVMNEQITILNQRKKYYAQDSMAIIWKAIISLEKTRGQAVHNMLPKRSSKALLKAVEKWLDRWRLECLLISEESRKQLINFVRQIEGQCQAVSQKVR